MKDEGGKMRGADLMTLNCPSCGNRLLITDDIERFTCRHCGAELAVTRDPGGETIAQIAAPTHGRLDDLSPAARQVYGQMMQRILADANGDGVPDVWQTSAQTVSPAALAPIPSPARSRFSLGGGLSVLFGLFWCCVFPLFFILPPLFSDSGKCALTVAQDDASVSRELGQPIRPIFPFTFLYSSEGAVTQEQYLIVLNGPKGFGVLLISGYQDPAYEQLEVEFKANGRSYLIYDGPRDCSRRTGR